MRGLNWFRLAATFAGIIGTSALAPEFGVAQTNPCVHCTNVWLDPNDPLKGMGHVAQDSDDGHTAHERGGGTHPSVVWAGTCGEKHPPGCVGGGIGGGVLFDFDRILEEVEILEELEEELHEIDTPISGADILAAYGTMLRQPVGFPIHYVAERAAIQVRRCDGYVVAHIPIAHLANPEVLTAIFAGQRESAHLAPRDRAEAGAG